MKKYVVLLSILIVAGCTDIDYREEKKVVIRKPVPKVEPVKEVVEEVVKLELYVTLNFDLDKWDIRAVDERRLDELAESIREKPGQLKITGHTDSRASQEYNQKLSEQRAQAVAEYLEGKLNLNSYDLEVEGKGKNRLLSLGKTEKDMASNRRVEVIFEEY